MDLIRRSQAGDEEAFAELFRQYQDLVFKTAYLMKETFRIQEFYTLRA